MRNKVVVALFMTVGLLALAGASMLVSAQQPAADLILTNGRIITVDAQFSIAQAVAVRGDRIVAVGTTTTRTLEAVALAHDGRVVAGSGATDLFIYPGFRFRVIQGLLTNFHLPQSSLLMLASAFAGRESVLAAYRQAIDQRYRFYSYGDAMLIV